MYGLLLENLAAFIKIQWGEGKWESIRRHAGVDAPSFSVHHVYAETLIPRLARSAVQVLGVGEQEFFEAMGVYFVEFMGQYGYDQVLSVLGRHMRDFLNGLDNLHEYLKFSYPRMRAPSFYCDNETMDGLVLHYRSKRRGFVHYAMGQIKQVAKHFYNTTCIIELLGEELDGEMMHVKYQLKFDNRAFCQAQSLVSLIRDEEQLPVKTSMLFELFPFCVVFCQEMVIRHTGHSLLNILKDLIGQCVTETFDMVRPLIPFAFHSILERQNNIFELVTVAPIQDVEPLYGIEDEDDVGVSLKLKGQMLYMEEWKMMMFLCTPQMQDLDSLLASGLYINDLSLHDCSRDLVLAGTQQSVELKLALDQEQQKTHKLMESMKQLDYEMKKTDELLYQMIPKQVADRIRRGENPVDTCEVFDMVSILFSDVVTFTEICSRITPMQVVSMLNHMYSLFDQLTERNGVYKVETIGDAYMVVSGAPNADANHAERICDMAMDMIDASKGIKDPSNQAEHLRLRVGVHSGNVVAGVVGVKMPRYCLFGDCVNTSSRMESSCEAGRIQISEVTKNLLPSTYDTEFRGEVAVKGKGQMNTFWLKGRLERIALSELQCNSFSWAAPTSGPNPLLERRQYSTFSSMEDVRAPSAPPAVEPKPRGPDRKTSGRAASAARLMKENSVAGTPPPAEGHLPFFLTHQPSLSSMNLDAAKAAVSQSLMSSKLRAEKAADQLSRAETMPNVRISEGSADSGLESKTKANNMTRSESFPVAAAILSNLEDPPIETKSSSSIDPVASVEPVKPAASAPQAVAPASLTAVPAPKTAVPAPQANVPVPQAAVPAPQVVVPKPPVATAPEAGKSAAKQQSNSNSNSTKSGSTNPSKATTEPVKSPVSPSGAGNQEQAESLLTKSALSNSYGNSANPTTSIPRPAVSSAEAGGSRSEKKARFLKRLRENKVALLTSDALAKMGCSGFASQPKDVVSQVCNLL